MLVFCLCPRVSFRACDIDVASVVIPRRNAVAPPDLARDAPVLDVAHPFVIGFGPVLRDEFNPSLFDGFDGLGREWADPHVPLIGQKRFDHGAGAVAARDHEFVVLDLFEQILGFEVSDDLLACLESVEPLIGCAR